MTDRVASWQCYVPVRLRTTAVLLSRVLVFFRLYLLLVVSVCLVILAEGRTAALLELDSAVDEETVKDTANRVETFPTRLSTTIFFIFFLTWPYLPIYLFLFLCLLPSAVQWSISNCHLAREAAPFRVLLLCSCALA